MDQGMSGEMTTAVFSRSRASCSRSFTKGAHSWWVSTMLRVWLQDTMPVKRAARMMDRYVPTFFSSFWNRASMPSSRPVPLNMPPKEADRHTMEATRTMDTMPPPLSMPAYWGSDSWYPVTMIFSRCPTGQPWTKWLRAKAMAMLTTIFFFTDTRKKLSTRMLTAGSTSQGMKLYRSYSPLTMSPTLPVPGRANPRPR